MTKLCKDCQDCGKFCSCLCHKGIGKLSDHIKLVPVDDQHDADGVDDNYGRRDEYHNF